MPDPQWPASAFSNFYQEEVIVAPNSEKSGSLKNIRRREVWRIIPNELYLKGSSWEMVPHLLRPTFGAAVCGVL